MKLKSMIFIILPILMVTSCADNKTGNEAQSANAATAENKVAANSADGQQGGIVGEWEQQYTCFDKNGNYQLEAEEKQPSNTRLGFNWFQFKADGNCLRDKDVRFEGTYEIQEKNNTKTLVIHGGDNLRYPIHELTGKELILGKDGAFMVFKRIK